MKGYRNDIREFMLQYEERGQLHQVPAMYSPGGSRVIQDDAELRLDVPEALLTAFLMSAFLMDDIPKDRWQILDVYGPVLGPEKTNLSRHFQLRLLRSEPRDDGGHDG